MPRSTASCSSTVRTPCRTQPRRSASFLKIWCVANVALHVYMLADTHVWFRRASPSSSPVLRVCRPRPLFVLPPNKSPPPPSVPISQLRNDAYSNLLGGLIIAGTFPTFPEVGLFFDGNVWRGNRTTKISNESFAAFGSAGEPGALIKGELRSTPIDLPSLR